MEEKKFIQRKVMVFVCLSILIAIIFFTRNLLVKNKDVNTQPRSAVTRDAHKSEEPCIQNFVAADYERTGKPALGTFLKSILLQKTSYNVYGSTVTYTAENISEINKTGSPDAPLAIRTPDMLILLTVVFMMFFFMSKVF
ncbi:MAG: hypothetical protein HYV59_09240 [Planctomycetes bacterium]|nr:hypothetical protein [Planctomycetota bacterium]